MQIVVRQISGLGNQLFQYAAGKYYAKHYGATMRMIIASPRNSVAYGQPRPFLLSHFTISAPVQESSLKDRLIMARRPGLKQAMTLLNTLQHTEVFNEQVAQRYTFLQDLSLKEHTETLYLVGYWQAHQLVHQVKQELRQDFTFKLPAQGMDLAVLNQIRACKTAVSLHVRRGDYTLAAEGNIALPVTYYTQAISYFRERLIDPVFFIFSDDIAFTKANLPRDLRAIFVDHNDALSSHEDLRLMSSCHHHIIANSTFSWWGAWLNQRPEKIVFAPKYWHLHPESYYPGLMPPEWILATP